MDKDFLMTRFMIHGSQKNTKTKGMFQNLANWTLYQAEIIIFMPNID